MTINIMTFIKSTGNIKSDTLILQLTAYNLIEIIYLIVEMHSIKSIAVT